MRVLLRPENEDRSKRLCQNLEPLKCRDGLLRGMACLTLYKIVHCAAVRALF